MGAEMQDMNIIKALISTLFVLIFLPGACFADASDDAMHAIAGEFMSPFCPGRLISDCPSSAASELKAKILSDLQSGKTRAEIEDQLIAQYGEAALAAPRFQGFGMASWLGPVVFLVLGLFGAFVWSRRMKVTPQDDAPLSEAERNRIEKEI